MPRPPRALVRPCALLAAALTLALSLPPTVSYTKTTRPLTQTGAAAPNDNFADAQEITGCVGSVTGDNRGATVEPGEPTHSQNGDAPNHTVWYEFTAFNNAEMMLETSGSSFDTLLTVHTGDALDNLQFLVGNTNVPEGGTHSRVRFNLRSGHTYRVVVDGEGEAAGIIRLHWRVSDCAAVAPTPTPAPVAAPFARELKLTASDAASDDQFGYQVAVDGDTAVVGAVGDDAGAGAAYVYTRDPATGAWAERAKLVAPARAHSDWFGADVALSGDTVVVGAPGDDLPGAFNQGSAYVFKRDAAGAWTLRQQLTSSDPAQDDEFGFSVAVVVNTIVVGEHFDDHVRADGTVAHDRGAAHVFERDHTTGLWTHFQKLTTSDGAAGDAFGVNVAFDGSTIVVGAYTDDLGSSPAGPVDEGSAYVFTLTVSFRWAELQKLSSPDPAHRDWFGLAVAVYGDTLVIGAELDDVGAHEDQGSLYVFTREEDAGEFAFSQKLNADDGAPRDFLGFSVALHGNALVAGAYQDFVGTKLQQGSAYVFTRANHLAPFTHQQKLTSGDGERADRYGIRVALDRDTVVVGAYLHDAPAGDGGAAYVYTRDPATTPTPTPTPAAGPVNVALASNGGFVTASSIYDSRFRASSLNNGDRRGLNWGNNGGWNDGTFNAYPDSVEVYFAGAKTIGEINVFTVQDAFASPAEPTEAMTFTKYGVTGLRIEYWTGSAWAALPGGAVSSNRNVWRRFTFAPLTTSKIRVVVTGALDGYSRLVEVEAWSTAPPPPPARTNHALAANGAVATASSTYDSRFPASSVINGDRRGLNWGAGGGWNDATANAYPDWLEVTFSGAKTITEVDLFTVQDNFASPSEPTETMTFTRYGVTQFDVQTWDGAQWTTVTGGAVTGNNKVWRKLTFPPVTATKIRVLTRNALDGYSRLTEIEAY